MTKLEQVARAMADVLGPETSWPVTPDGWAAALPKAARAAVKALRDDEALPEFPEWNAHIDAILSEKPDVV